MAFSQLAAEFEVASHGNSVTTQSLSKSDILQVFLSRTRTLAASISAEHTGDKSEKQLKQIASAAAKNDAEAFGRAMFSLQNDYDVSTLNKPERSAYVDLVDTLYSAYLTVATEAGTWKHTPGLSQATVAGYALAGIASLVMAAGPGKFAHSRWRQPKAAAPAIALLAAPEPS